MPAHQRRNGDLARYGKGLILFFMHNIKFPPNSRE